MRKEVLNNHISDIKKLGSFLRSQREKKQLTQKELAQKINITTFYVGMIERGQTNVTFTVLYSICNTLDIQILMKTQHYGPNKL